MIEVILTVGDEETWVEVEDPEAAVVAARTIWDENRERGFYACRRSLLFVVDGRAVRMMTTCP